MKWFIIISKLCLKFKQYKNCGEYFWDTIYRMSFTSRGISIINIFQSRRVKSNQTALIFLPHFDSSTTPTYDTILDRTLDHTRGCTACLYALHAVCIFMKLCHIVPLHHCPESCVHSAGPFRLPENAEIAFSSGKLGTSFHDALTSVVCNIFLVAFNVLIK